jgi:hypothetical protein
MFCNHLFVNVEGVETHFVYEEVVGVKLNIYCQVVVTYMVFSCEIDP